MNMAMDNNRQKIVQDMDCVVSPKAGKPVLHTNLEHEEGQPGDGVRRGAVIANYCLRVLPSKCLSAGFRGEVRRVLDGRWADVEGGAQGAA